jgi:hypothetical protein
MDANIPGEASTYDAVPALSPPPAEHKRAAKAADQQRLARAAMEKVSAKQEQKLSNLGDGLTVRGKK